MLFKAVYLLRNYNEIQMKPSENLTDLPECSSIRKIQRCEKTNERGFEGE